MDKVIDFTGCERYYRPFGGSDRKFGVSFEGEGYMLKFTETHATRAQLSTSYVNSVISEYISSHIASTMGFPVHDTTLGLYTKVHRRGKTLGIRDEDKEIVVGCKDFRKPNEDNLEFREVMKGIYNSSELKRVVRLDQIYHTIEEEFDSDEMRNSLIDRYWETFVTDALVGNFDRHAGNWGFLVNRDSNTLSLAPLYDFGSSMLPQISEKGMKEIINNRYEMVRRCLVFPSPALYITDKKVGKIGYYDMLASNYDENCTKAVLKIVPRIDIAKINDVIDDTPLISDVRKNFLKEYIRLRKEIVIDRAYERCKSMNYDKDALYRIENGIQVSDKDVEQNIHQFDQFFNKEEYKTNSISYAESNEGNDLIHTAEGDFTIQEYQSMVLNGNAPTPLVTGDNMNYPAHTEHGRGFSQP